jgi:catechol 2,3-dioxygenase-like lactoylglutathione lyase family enzyme
LPSSSYDPNWASRSVQAAPEFQDRDATCDQDQAEWFYTEMMGFKVKTYSPDERWLSVVAPEDPDGVQLVLHRTDELARAFQQASHQVGRPVLSLRTDDCVGAAERPRPKGGVRQGTRQDGLRRHGRGLRRHRRQPHQPPPGLSAAVQPPTRGPGPNRFALMLAATGAWSWSQETSPPSDR